MSKKALKIWNGRGHGKEYGKGRAYVAAYSMSEAARLLSAAFETNVSSSEISYYYSPNWGINMDGITPTEPCVYATTTFSGTPKRVI